MAENANKPPLHITASVRGESGSYTDEFLDIFLRALASGNRLVFLDHFTCTRTAVLARLAHVDDQLGVQLAARYGVKRGVDGLVDDLEAWLVRMHSLQCACDLLERVSLAQQALGMAPQRAVLCQAQAVSCCSRQRIGALLRKQRTVAARHWRVPPFLRYGSLC